MKWKNQRTKIFAAISGVLVVVVAALVVFTQTSGTELFGTTQVQITPYQSNIQMGLSYTLSMNGAKNCTWSDSANLLLFSNNSKGDPIRIQGIDPGKTNVTAKCDGKTGVGIVTVANQPTPVPTKAPLSITPLNPRVHPDTMYEKSVFFKAVNASAGCDWSTTPGDKIGWALINGGYEITIPNKYTGTYTITAKCGNETAKSVLEFTNMMP
jgi:hypothetical protein